MLEDLKKFSDELKQKREKENITLQNIHQKTRIDIKFLKAIEEGDFNIIDDVYIRAFIKGYANSIGLDADETLKKYDLAKKGKLHNVDIESESQLKNEEQKPAKKFYSAEYLQQQSTEHKQSRKLNPLIFVVSSILIIVVMFVYLVFIKSDSTQIIKERSFDEVLKGKEETAASSERFEIIPDAVDTTKKEISLASQLNLKINAVDTTWLKVTIDDTEEEEFTLFPNQNRSLSAKESIKLLIGNAAGINLFMNDSLINLVGKQGEIKNIEIDSEGLRYLKIQEKKLDVQ